MQPIEFWKQEALDMTEVAKKEAADAQALRLQLANAHQVLGACEELLRELDASGNYPHSSTAIGLMLLAIKKALQ